MNIQSRKLHRYASLLGALLLVGMMPATYATATAKSSAPPAHPNAPAATAPAATAPAATAPAQPSTTPPVAPTPPQQDQSDQSVQSDQSDQSDSGSNSSETFPKHGHWHRHRNHVNVNVDSDDNSVFNFGGNSNLAAGDQADSVVSIMGSSTSAGDVSQSVVSVLGNSHVTGPVGDSVVAVLGNAYVDSKVEHDVVAVLGNVTLGPNADIGGDIVAVGGTVHQDPAAQVHGSVQNVGIGQHFTRGRNWVEHCLMMGRPLAFVSGIGWAWTLAFVALALYLFASLLFAPAVEHCIHVLEKYPGQSLLTMILTMIATPIVFVILFITVIGIVAVPFLALALFLMKFFGKLVILAWIGRRLLRSHQPITAMDTVSAVLVGGLLVMLMYCVPVLGFILYNLLGLVGLGVVIYALLLQIQGRRTTATAGTAPGGASPPPGATAAQMSAVLNGEPEAAAAAGGAAATASDTQGAHVPPPLPAPGSARSGRVSGEAAIALPRAGFWIRMLALLLDAVLVGVVMHLIGASSDMFLIVLAAYGVVMWRLRGSTVGGIIFNLAVVKHDGHEMDWGTAVVRALSAFLSLFALGLGFIWIAIDSENRSWHDKIAGTVVVRVP